MALVSGRDPRRGGSSRAYTEWRAAREAERKARLERLRDLSDHARETRRPGQTLGHRVRELLRVHS